MPTDTAPTHTQSEANENLSILVKITFFADSEFGNTQQFVVKKYSVSAPQQCPLAAKKGGFCFLFRVAAKSPDLLQVSILFKEWTFHLVEYCTIQHSTLLLDWSQLGTLSKNCQTAKNIACLQREIFSLQRISFVSPLVLCNAVLGLPGVKIQQSPSSYM